MNRYMMEEFHNDPALLRKLAHRERNRAIREAFASLGGYVKTRLHRESACGQPAGSSAWARRNHQRINWRSS